MKELLKLERRLHWSESLHLALLTLCIAFPIALLFTEDPPIYRLLWSLGTVIPVLLIRWTCERVERPLNRALLCLGILALTYALTNHHYHWVYYCICSVPSLVSGLFLPRSRGRLLLTVPTLYWLLAPLPGYALGKAVGVPLLTALSVALTALLMLNYLVHTNQTRLLEDIRMASGTEVSVVSMIRQNRKVLILYALAGVLVLTAIPLLLRGQPQGTPEQIIYEYENPIQVATGETLAERDYMPSQGGTPLPFLEVIKDLWVWFLVSLRVLVPLVGIFLGLRMLLGLLRKRKRWAPPKVLEGMTIERLEEEPTRRTRERVTGYERRLRRRYEKLILRRTEGAVALRTLTPTELEAAAGLSGHPAAGELHGLYARTRYTPQKPTREDYRRFKELEAQLK